jgi:uncharacterized iron-regulated protein
MMMKVSLLMVCALVCSFFAPLASRAQGGQKQSANVRVYDSTGKQVTLDEVVEAMSKIEVVFVGETHNDALAHQLEAQLLERAEARYGSKTDSKRTLVLSLEMFERDVQTTLDEYLKGLIPERMFFKDSRPWSNYQSDYRPLVEFARTNNLQVLAANAPARYANMVSRLGRNSLAGLPEASKAWIAPLPYGEAGPAYAAKFNRLMESMPPGHETGAQRNLLDAQVLRDATMAYAIAQNLKGQKSPLLIHVTGIFHVEGRMGVPEQLETYRPRTPMLVIAILPAREASAVDAESLKKRGDFVILTGVGGAATAQK